MHGYRAGPGRMQPSPRPTSSQPIRPSRARPTLRHAPDSSVVTPPTRHSAQPLARPPAAQGAAAALPLPYLAVAGSRRHAARPQRHTPLPWAAAVGPGEPPASTPPPAPKDPNPNSAAGKRAAGGGPATPSWSSPTKTTAARTEQSSYMGDTDETVACEINHTQSQDTETGVSTTGVVDASKDKEEQQQSKDGEKADEES
ncbi:hypothetical protein OsI_24959 [Oryza sativa Indica Group]|uniref:Uncharacterized protein n=1 Tax=Oryza sativa subsp. indica TaxID=39946 RepID=B8B7E1_ORYSI|nr:hypothetical protein OsI_24959 [Oryza sativa Indica Group]